MRAGVIGTVDGSFDVVGSFTDSIEDGDHERTRCLEISRVFSLPSGEMAFRGTAAIEATETVERPRIDGTEIRVEEDTRAVTRRAEFVGVPGEFVVADGSKGTFAFDLIGEETNAEIERATIDLDAFLADRPDAAPWKAGFAGREGNVENGVLHGSDLFDGAASGLLDGATLNQLGVEHDYDGERAKITAARSGYVEVYRPAEFDAGAYLQYLADEFAPYLS